MDIYFSIIIPCYNAEKYLKRCLNSILNQNYKYFEIIIINDGSTDNSLEIIKEYSEKFQNIKYINQRNQGVAIARNVGINLVQGEKFVFIDADDYISSNYLWYLNEAFKNKNTDIVRFNANLINDNEPLDKEKYFCPKFESIDGKKALKFFVDNNVRYGPLWLYCYDTYFYKSHGFAFIKNKIHEDFYNIYILSMATSIQGIEYIGYNYIKNNTSITSIKNRISELKRAQDVLYVYDFVIKKLKESFVDNEYIFNYIFEDVSMFLNIPLKYLIGEDKSYYLKELELRKKLVK